MCVFFFCFVFLQGARHPYASEAGKDSANPTAILLCAANMLQHMHLERHSTTIRDAVEKTIRQGKVGTFIVYLFGVLHCFQHCTWSYHDGWFCEQRKPVHTSWSRVCTVNCRPLVNNYQLSHIKSTVWTADLRGGRRVCYHCATMAPSTFLVSIIHL